MSSLSLSSLEDELLNTMKDFSPKHPSQNPQGNKPLLINSKSRKCQS